MYPEVLYVFAYGRERTNLIEVLCEGGYKYINISDVLIWASGLAICESKRSFTLFRHKLGDTHHLMWTGEHDTELLLIPEEAKTTYILSRIRTHTQTQLSS